GSAGAKGDKGDVGATGAQGPQGIAGANGLNGAAGVAGAKGDKGDVGATGAQGPQGIAGANGLNGAAGVAGAKGDKGDTGDAGTVTLTAGAGILGTTIQGNGGVIAVNTGTGVGQIPVIGTNGRLPASIIDAGVKTVYIKDLKANGTTGGSCDPAKNWEQIRDLNTINGDTTFSSLASNTITLAAGTYDIEINAPAYLDGFHKAILVNAQTGEVVLVGSNARSHNVSGGMEPSRIMGALTLIAPASFVIKHRCATLSSTGFGAAASFGVDEVYTQVKITKMK
ncbi:MAG: collagen-like protein, partial [Rhizobacter sp.]|nr:collagen-like protein [Bacteriovorax sp.]